MRLKTQQIISILILICACMLFTSTFFCKKAKPIKYKNVYIEKESKWKKIYRDAEIKHLKQMDSLKVLTLKQVETKYQTIEKFVFVYDTISLTPLDTCKQSLVYYSTQLKGKEKLLEICNDISKEKSLELDTLNQITFALAEDNDQLTKKHHKQSKRKKRWRKIAFALGLALTYNLSK
jgi:hypothetical protein